MFRTIADRTLRSLERSVGRSMTAAVLLILAMLGIVGLMFAMLLIAV